LLFHEEQRVVKIRAERKRREKARASLAADASWYERSSIGYPMR
jgi:hypothetical protein